MNAVQTLSRLNRTMPPEKQGTTVLDFANEAAEIKATFEDYYEATLLTRNSPVRNRATSAGSSPTACGSTRSWPRC